MKIKRKQSLLEKSWKLATKTSLFGLLLLICKNIKISKILGAKTAFFSASQCLIPTILQTHPLIGTCYHLSKFFFLKKIYSILLLYQIPLLLQVFYLFLFFSKKRIIKQTCADRIFLVAVCVICIALFTIHPTGRGGFIYTVFWFIPIISAIFGVRNFFMLSLSATLLSHAIGSNLWLYIKDPLTSAEWVELMPIVFLERTLIATSATFINSFIKIAERLILTKIRKIKSIFGKTGVLICKTEFRENIY